MKAAFNTLMRQATQLTRTHKLVEATRVIQHALSGRGRSRSADEQASAGPRLIELQGDAAENSQGFQRQQDVGAASAGLQQAAFKRPAAGKKPFGDGLRLLREADLPGFEPGSIPFGKKAPRVPVPGGAAYVTRTFTCQAGSREYKVYVPSHRESKAPLIVMLHGCTQNPDDFAVGTGMNRLAEEHGCVVAYPRQSTKANQMGCWNWFNPKDQTRDAGEPSIIAGMTRSIMAEFDIDAERVYIAGLSAGGAMAAIMAATYPELYAATGIHSGLACGSATDMASAFAAMRGSANPAGPAKKKSRRKGASDRVRTIVFHGASDQKVHPSNGDALLAEARAGLSRLAQEIESEGVAGSRAYTRTVITDGSDVPEVELWAVEGLDHAWSGGNPEGSYADQRGPDASREMLRFFLHGAAQPRPN